jgi:WS/DGAT/MGAT family acyltransferase
MKLVSPLDAAWLYVERRDAPMHVGCLQIFSFPDDAPESYVRDMVAQMRAGRDLTPPFSLKLAPWRLKSVLPAWIEERQPDMDYHLCHVVLPKPGGNKRLVQLVSELQSTELALTQPLWRCYVIEGVAPRRFAWFTKIHHSLMDGIGGVHVLQAALSKDPQKRDMPAPWARAPGRAVGATLEHPDHVHGGLKHALELAADQFRSAPGLVRAFSTFVKIARRQLHSALSVPYLAPHTILNGRTSVHRGFATQQLPLKRVQAVARGAEVTVNDVFLAICAGALRRYLSELGALPGEPLVAGVPVSVRPAGDTAVGTAITFLLASLHTDCDDPLLRLQAIHVATLEAKEHLQKMHRAALTDYTLLLMGPYIAELMAGVGGHGRPVFNLAISNVPGPVEPLYYNGARMEAMYPMSVLTHGQSLNITVLSYAGQMNIGYTVCNRAVPHVERLAAYMRDAFDELAALVAERGRKSAARKTAARKTVKQRHGEIA